MAILATTLLVAAVPSYAAPAVRIKDLTEIEGVRPNPIIGYGLVVGLQGTGDGTSAAFTIQSLANILKRSGITVPQSSIRVRNIAAVMVTAELHPFARSGQRIDVQVSSIGDAKSLQGGTLLMTPLNGPDGKTYAVAQGSVSIGGAFLGGGGGNSVQKNHPTAGRVPGGALVERRVPLSLAEFESLRLLLKQPDFATAARIALALNSYFGQEVARAEDPTSVILFPPQQLAGDPVGMLARVESVMVHPDIMARVVVNERTGTVVMGTDVKVSTVALAHGNLTIDIRTEQLVSQPTPFSEGGETVTVPSTDVLATEGPNKVITIDEGISVGELVDALNEIGVSSRDMIAIFQAIRAAGALHAELVIL